MSDKIYLVYKAWGCSIENTISDAFGYDPCGYLETEEDAKIFLENNNKKITKKEYGWAADETKYKYYYEILNKLETSNEEKT